MGACALQEGNSEAVRIMLASQNASNALHRKENANGFSPLASAVVRGQTAVCQALMKFIRYGPRPMSWTISKVLLQLCSSSCLHPQSYCSWFVHT